MDEKELKKLAKSMGYNIIKIKRENFLPCFCGHNRREHWDLIKDGTWHVGLKCMYCGESVLGKNETDAKRKWNKMIREKQSGCSNTKS